jgi:hypothetical protein
VNTEKRLQYKPKPDFTLIAIATSEDAYRLSWLINQAAGIRLTRIEPLKIWHESLENPGEFLCYQYTNASDVIVYRLIANRSDSGFLEMKFKQFDFFLQCFDMSEQQTQELLNKIKGEKDILMTSLISNPGKNLVQKLMI